MKHLFKTLSAVTGRFVFQLDSLKSQEVQYSYEYTGTTIDAVSALHSRIKNKDLQAYIEYPQLLEETLESFTGILQAAERIKTAEQAKEGGGDITFSLMVIPAKSSFNELFRAVSLLGNVNKKHETALLNSKNDVYADTKTLRAVCEVLEVYLEANPAPPVKP